MAVEAIPGVLDGVTLEGKHFRMIAQALAGGDVASFAGGVSASNGGAHGVTTADGLDVTESGTPAMSVDVAPGACLITGTDNLEQGVYVGRNNTSTTLTIAAADATNDRNDLVIAQARDAEYSGVDRDFRLAVVTGTPSGTPVDPSLASHPNALVLARVVVPNGASSITDTDIDDLRTFAGREEILDRQAAAIQPRVFTPGGNVDGATAAPFVDWFAFANVDVPSWATQAYVLVNLTRVFLAAAVDSDWDVKIGIGGQYSASMRMGLDSSYIDQYFARNLAFSGVVTLSGSGSQAFNFQTSRLGGTTVRMDTASRAIGLVIFLP